MKLIKNIYGGFINLAYLLKSEHSYMTKIRVIFLWIKINFKYIFFSKFFKLKNETIFGFKIEAFTYDSIRFLYEEIFFRNEYFFEAATKKPIIFDCGANIGFATIFFKWLYPESVVYAFEPDQKTFEVLKRNVVRNKLTDVHVFNCALSGKNGTIDFFVDSKNPGSLMMSTIKERMSKDKITVDSISLSSLICEREISRIEYMKIDIEGSENEVIFDLDKNNLLKNIEKFGIEYHHKINGHNSRLGEFLEIFEKNKFEYQVDAKCIPISVENKFQDILLYVYRSGLLVDPIPSDTE